MSPESLAVTLRPRNGWEAVDLGFQLARHCGAALFVPATIFLLGISGLLLGLSIYFDGFALAWISVFVWWLKPVVDRMALHVLSRAVFGERMRWQDALRTLPGVMRHNRLLAGLTWRRLDPYRSLRLPVDQLEGLPSKEASARRKLLSQRVGSYAIGLLFCMPLFEIALTFALLAFLMFLLPESYGVSESVWQVLFWGDESTLPHVFLALSYAIIMAVLEPFYVAGGFGLYLKRRTDLEAWDVELQLRRTTTRHAAKAAVLCLAIFLGWSAAMPDDARAAAAEPPRRSQAAEQAPAEIREVLKHPDFAQERKQKTLRAKNKEKKKDEPEPPWYKALMRFLAEVGVFFAGIGRFIGWILLGCLGLALLIYLLRQLDLRRRERLPPPPTRVAGLDIHPDSLPADIAAAVRALLSTQRLREALALLYRASLSRLAHHEHIPFEPGDTEGDCLRRVAIAASPARDYFARLTTVWQRVAYARRDVPAGDAEHLCVEWQQHFGATA